MDVRSAVWLLFPSLLACGEAAPGPAFECSEREAPAPLATLDVSSTDVAFQLAPCGELAWIDAADGSLRLRGPDLGEAEVLADGLETIETSPEGAALWARVPSTGRALWVDLRTRRTREREVVARAGFAGSVAWTCEVADGAIERVDAEGSHRLVGGLPSCFQVWSARRAPVIVYPDAEGTLVRLDAETGEAWPLAEIPYDAGRGDDVRLSPDGRVLWHRVYSRQQWLGIFDLEAPEGDRHLASIAFSTGLPEIVEAPGSGHVAAFRVSDENLTVILTEDLWLNRYEGGWFHAFSPGGDRALLRYPLTDGTGWTLDLAHLDGTRLDPTGEDVGRTPSIVRSEHGGAVAARFDAPYAWEPLVIWRWSDGAHRIDRDDVQRIEWVGEDGTSLVRLTDGDAALLSVDGAELQRWPSVGSASAFRAHQGDAVLVWTQPLAGDHRLDVVRTSDGAAENVATGAAIARVQVDADGDRVAFVRVGVSTEVLAGAIPRP